MQIIHSSSTSPTFNLAAEEFLFSERQDDLLFLYVNEPSVIIGCNQAIRNEVNLDFCADNNIQIMRRISGGGAVFHDLGNLNFCFISNRIIGKSALEAVFLEPIVCVLRKLDIPVQIGTRKDLWLPGGFKVSGTASHVTKNRELHHGTLLYDSDLEKLQKSLSPIQKDESVKGIASVPSQVKNIRSFMYENFMPVLNSKEMFWEITHNLLKLFCLESFYVLNVSQIEKIKYLQVTKYESENWIFKK